MNFDTFRDYCLNLKGVTEEMPFGETTLVFKVMGKMFALTGLDVFSSVNLKCDPDIAVELRERYNAVKPGFHMNKKHWNTVAVDGSVPDKLVLQWTRDSYELVVKALPKKDRAALEEL